jgi:phosphomannomutase
MRQALADFGILKCTYVPLQTVPDGNFPTAKKPNPEESEALDLGIKTLQEVQGDILIATDPDADRMGVVALDTSRPQRPPTILTGNQIYTLMVEYILRQKQGRLPANGTVGTVYVGTPLIEAICKKYQVHTTTVLPGFKYFAQKIQEWEESGAYSFIIGGEESYGTLYGTYTRDKDAIAAARLISEIAAFAKAQGSNLVQELYRIWSEYGYYKEELLTLTFSETKEGREQMEQVLKKARTIPPENIGGLSVKRIDDLLKPEDCLRLQLPRSNVLGFVLESGNRVIIRPSGTEPKVKIYLMANSVQEVDCVQLISQLKEDVRKKILG